LLEVRAQIGTISANHNDVDLLISSVSDQYDPHANPKGHY
jgi:hypothetical protein